MIKISRTITPAKGTSQKKVALTFSQKNPKAFKNPQAVANVEHGKLNPSKAKRYSRMEKPGYDKTIS